MPGCRGTIRVARCRLTLIGLLVAPIVAASGSDASPATRLETDRPIEQQLSGGQTHEYSVPLSGGQALDVVVDQRGIDVFVEASDPGGQKTFQMDGPIGSFGEERATLIAGRAGSYTISVRALSEGRAAGRYSIRIRGPRTATARDRVLAAAQDAWADGYRLDHDRIAASAQRALAQYQRAASLWDSVGELRQESIALLGAARVLRFLGSSRAARDADARVVELARASRDSQIEAKAIRHLATFLLSSGDPRAAMPLLQRGRSLARTVGDREEESMTLNRLGEACWLLSRYQSGIDYFVESLDAIRDLRDVPAQARATAGLGLAYQEVGDPEKAAVHYREAAVLWRRANRPEQESLALRNLALAYLSIGAPARALETLETALEQARRVGNREAQAAALEGVGFARLQLGDPDGARGALEDGLRLWRKLGDVSGESTTLVNLGRSDESAGRHGEARRAWEEAIQIARRSLDSRVEAVALAEIARLDLALGNLEEARSAIEKSLDLFESIREELVEPALRRSFLSSKQDPYATAVEVLLRLDARSPGRGFRALAFEASERGRARALAEEIAEARLDLSSDAPGELRREEEELSALLARLERGEKNESSEGGPSDRRLGEAEEQWDRLMGKIRSQRSAAFQPPRPASVSSTQKLLDSETAVVSYAIGADGVVAFVVTRRTLEAWRLPVSPEQLAESVENYVGLISRDDRERWRALAGRLYAALVGPWRATLPPAIRRLVIIPDGVLDSLPYEALSPPERSAVPMVEDFVISYAPSATVFEQLETGRTRTTARVPARLLAVASPAEPRFVPPGGGDVDGETFDLKPLPHAALEAKRIAAFGGEGSEVLIGGQASARSLRNLPADRFGVIHFAVHGLLNPRAPSRSALLLAAPGEAPAGEGLLRAREIYRLRLGSDLVVLSACQTARGRTLPGEGVQGLTQAFFGAGAESVVASLWDVADKSTADFMEFFYRHLASGQDKASALRAAKLELRRSDPNLAPRFWAPFVLIGEPSATVPLRQLSWWQRLFS